MPSQNYNACLEAISLLLIEEDLSQADPLKKLVELLGELQINMPDMADHQALGAIVQCRSLADALKAGRSKNAEQDLGTIGEKINFLQERVDGAVAAAPEKVVQKGFALPDWVDRAVFEEFVAAQKLNLEELETEVFDLETGNDDALAAIKRRVHTLKGESGVLGLEDLAKVCHGIEDFVAENSDRAVQVETLFQVKDWIESALVNYTDGQNPSLSAQDFIAGFGKTKAPEKKVTKKAAKKTRKVSTAKKKTKAAAESSKNSPQHADPQDAPKTNSSAQKSSPKNPGPASPPSQEQRAEPALETDSDAEQAAPSSVQRDEETIALIAEFLTEGQDGLGQADEILIAAEQNGVEPDQVNAMFRVFHTIKGVSSFLDFPQVTSLAHKTETLLNLVREGSMALEGGALDVVFDATAMLREMSNRIYQAVEAETSVPNVTGHAALISRLESVIRGEALAVNEPAQKSSAAEIKTQSVKAPVEVGKTPLAENRATASVVEAQPVSSASRAEKIEAAEVAPSAAMPASPGAAGNATKRKTGKIRETVKVDLERVESLVEMIGELVIVESMVVHSPEIQSSSTLTVRNYLGQLTKITRDLQDIGMRMRMVPVRGVFQKMARMVRDLARKKEKNIRFALSGEGTEMDRSLVEQIADPLVHMIRNAVDHGIEDADEREVAGKDPVGLIQLSAYHQGGNIVIEISDDGAGLDKDAIMKKALEKGIVSPTDKLSDNEIHNLIFAPGFSTAKVVSEISGRGVGMDVVRRNIKAMRGRVSITSTPGHGSVFQLMLPLTTAIIDGMLIRCGTESFIIPTLSIVEAVQPTSAMLHSMAGRGELMTLRGEALPLLRLDKMLAIPDAMQKATEALVVVVESVGRRVGVLVDDVVTQQQVVIKSVSGGVKEIKYISGAAILSNGRVGLILNVDEISSLAGVGKQGSVEDIDPDSPQVGLAEPQKENLLEAGL